MIDTRLSTAARDALRAEKLAALSPRYSPLLHVIIPPIWGGSVIAVCALFLDDVRLIELLIVPVVLIASNAFEWRIHRDGLHKRLRIMPALYDRHTPVHHRVYVSEDMELRDWRELALILIPPWAGFPLFAMLTPIAAAIWFLVSHNVALLFMATCMFYVVSYELLHMSYHLPKSSRVGRNPVIRALARHHSIHHDPRFMQRWNMNVTIPLWDIVRRTRLKTNHPPAAHATATAHAAAHATGHSTDAAVEHAEPSTPAAAPAIQ